MKKNEIPPTRGKDRMVYTSQKREGQYWFTNPERCPRAVAKWSEAHIQNHVEFSDDVRHGSGTDSLAYVDAGDVGVIVAVV